MYSVMTSPLKFNVADLLRSQGAEAMPEQRSQTGPAPERIGLSMIAVEKGDDITVDATLTPLGSGVLVDADVTGTLTAQCARCLRELHPHLDLHVSQVFSADDSFVTGDAAPEDLGSGDEIPAIVGDDLDLLQTVIDEAGLNLPFAPVCEEGCEIDTPEGVETGVLDDGDDAEEEEEKVDPRWSGLEKFL